MFERTRSLTRIVGLLVCVLGLVPGAAHAQRVLVTHPPLPNPLLSASGRFIVAVIDNRFLVEDTDQVFDLYRYDLSTNLWARVPRASLVGSNDPSIVSSSSIELLSVSDDGRYVAYAVRRPATPGGLWSPPVLVRHDLETRVRQVVRDAAVHPFAQPVMSRDGSTLAWVGANHAVFVGKAGQTPVAVGQACAMTATYCPASVALTARGERVLYAVVDGDLASLETFEPSTNDRRRYPSFRFAPVQPTRHDGVGAVRTGRVRRYGQCRARRRDREHRAECDRDGADLSHHRRRRLCAGRWAGHPRSSARDRTPGLPVPAARSGGLHRESLRPLRQRPDWSRSAAG